MNKTITEEQLKKAFKDAIITYNKQVIATKSDVDKITLNKLILNFVGNVLDNLGLEYQNKEN